MTAKIVKDNAPKTKNSLRCIKNYNKSIKEQQTSKGPLRHIRARLKIMFKH